MASKWDPVVNTLVVLFSLFFIIIGLAFLWMVVDPDERVAPGPRWEKGALGVMFLLAAAPMLYYVFSENAKGLPPAKKKSKSPPAPPEPPA